MTDAIDLTGVQTTMLATLYLRALDSRSRRPVLGDTVAAEVVDRIAYDFSALQRPGVAGNRFPVALRARQLDAWTTGFLQRHPRASVVQLGCGLDSRAFRLALPPDVRWIDVDHADVIGIHRRLYPEPSWYRTIGASVTDPGWLDEIQAGPPVLIVAEGLLMYLTEPEIGQLLGRVVDRFGTGELLSDGLAPWAVRASQRSSKRVRGDFPRHRTAIRDGRDLERWEPRLTHRETVAVVAQYAEIPDRGHRTLYRLLSAVPAVRDVMRVFRCTF
ncbi:class I SAM-dependent methyltransferase [Pseudonocardia humida]|uniref:Class I SAM-dependent methyltransferase n=1 Tax=Pseudonocardia humida TaxID=2800819 RepID=A0ABT1AAG6_9PSEU|nr:class I SAM-dependent methyltransferase [Pseudonocardia humida]MCO1659804.1 class I SAM-dependent methyltransferase [Pseudonocardia humida]